MLFFNIALKVTGKIMFLYITKYVINYIILSLMKLDKWYFQTLSLKELVLRLVNIISHSVSTPINQWVVVITPFPTPAPLKWMYIVWFNLFPWEAIIVNYYNCQVKNECTVTQNIIKNVHYLLKTLYNKIHNKGSILKMYLSVKDQQDMNMCLFHPMQNNNNNNNNKLSIVLMVMHDYSSLWIQYLFV